MCDCHLKRIVLAGYSRVGDRYGLPHAIARIEIRTESFMPDVYVRFDRDVLALRLYDDARVIEHVMGVLRGLGYEGPVFERAELGLQGRDFIVLEPPKQFRAFAECRFGWRDLTKAPSAA
jgi:hypothetical protein